MPSDGPSATPPETRAPRLPGAANKKPRYLLVALIMALVFGAGCWTEGCARLAFYRGEADDAATLNQSVQNAADRTRVEALYTRYTAIADAARSRAIPMAAAVFVLGAALLALASRALAGKTNTRGPLLQVVVVQALVMIAMHFVIPDVRNAELDWDLERRLAEKHETMPAEQYDQLVPLMHSIRRVGIPGLLVLRTLASALIVVALTRQRARDFFEAAGRTATER